MAECYDTRDRLWPIQELLRVLLDDADEMLGEAADENQDRWLDAIVEKMLANLQEQFRIEETGGYLEDVLEQYPEWHPQVVHLQQEHRLLEEQLRDVSARIKRQLDTGAVNIECRRQLRDWIAWYRQHERRERALVQEAFVLEVGQGE